MRKQITKTQEIKKGLIKQLLTKVDSTEFKNSPLGKIPKSWEVVKVKEIGQIISGGTPKTENKDYWDGDIFWITPTDITNNRGKKYMNKTKRTITVEGLKNSSANMLPINSLVICTRATIGDSIINKVPLSTNQGCKSIIPKGNYSVEYLFYRILNDKKILIKKSNGSTFLELSTKDFKKLTVISPPLPEQKKIAEILSTVDAKIEIIDQQVSKTQELKKGLMQRLLTKGIGHTEFKETKLGEIFEITQGGYPSPIKNFITKSKDGLNWIKIRDVEKVNKYIYSTNERIKKEGLKKTVLVRENDLILSKSMNIGTPYIMKTEGCIYDGWVLLERKSEDLSIDFMYYMLSSEMVSKQSKSKAAGSTIKHLKVNHLSTIKALIPPLQEQQEIALILSTVDEKLDLMIEKKTKYQELKKGLMQQLLTGKIRVNHLINKPSNI